eukprot:360570-Pleurochrysis_carterae.AAC.5
MSFTRPAERQVAIGVYASARRYIDEWENSSRKLSKVSGAMVVEFERARTDDLVDRQQSATLHSSWAQGCLPLASPLGMS